MNKRFYRLFEEYKKQIKKYPVKLYYMLVIEQTNRNFNMEYHKISIKDEIELEEQLYELCENNCVYFPSEQAELTTRILKYKKI